MDFTSMQPTSIDQLLETYDTFFIDAYGVLVTSAGALPGAAWLIRELRQRSKSFFILTNDASRTPENCARFYQSRGLEIESSDILSAGLAIQPAFQTRRLKKPRCAVLGTQDTMELVSRACGVPESISQNGNYDAVVIGDDSGFDILPTMNALLSSIHRSIINGKTPALLLANPDVLYPVGQGAFGFTSGSLAHLLELGIKHLHPDLELRFEVLGKPEPWLFEEAIRRSGTTRNRIVMLGDQIPTDILGANRASINSALVTTGITTSVTVQSTTSPLKPAPVAVPTHILHSLVSQAPA